MFRWTDSAVSYGHSPFGNMWAYRFENLGSRDDKFVDSLKAAENRSECHSNPDKAGNLMIPASKEFCPEEVYGIYKRRCSVEERFDAERTVCPPIAFI